MSTINVRARHQARRKALQALYQWSLADNSIAQIEQLFLPELNPQKVDVDYFRLLLRQVNTHSTDLEALFNEFLDRPLAQLDPIELNILRLASYELKHCPELPYKVVINEALELAKAFGAEDGHKYVNGILDQLAKVLRPVEFKQDH